MRILNCSATAKGFKKKLIIINWLFLVKVGEFSIAFEGKQSVSEQDHSIYLENHVWYFDSTQSQQTEHFIFFLAVSGICCMQLENQELFLSGL